MTVPDLDQRLEAAIAERNAATGKGGAAQVARLLGISDSQLSQYRAGRYPSPETIRQKIREVLGGETVACPELGEITLAECAGHKKRPPMTDSFYARIYRACRRCQTKGGRT